MPENIAARIALTLDLFKWRPMATALENDEIRAGKPILAVSHGYTDHFYQVVFWDQDAADGRGEPNSLGAGYGWTTMDQEIAYHTEFFSYWMYLMPPPGKSG